MRGFLRPWRLLFAALWIVCALAAPGAVHASPLDMYGFGTRAIAMGGAFTGLADDYAAVYYNPAGMIYNEGNHMAVGFMAAKNYFDLKLVPIDGITKRKAALLHAIENEKVDIDDSTAYFMGFTSKLNRYLALGLLAYLPTDYMVRLNPIDSHFPSFIMYENRAKRAVTYVGAALSPVSGFSIGGGLSVFADSKGVFKIPVEMKNRDTSGNTLEGKDEDLDVDADLILDFPFSYTPYAGVMVRPCEWLRLGASYRGSFQWDVTVDVDARLTVENYQVNLSDLSELAPGLLPLKGVIELHAPALGNKPLRVPIELEGLDGTLTVNASVPVRVLADMSDHWKPQEAAFGGAVKAGDAWTISGDVTWYDWSEYPSPDLRLIIDDWNINLATLPTSMRARIRTLSVPVLGTVGPLPPVQVTLPGLTTNVKIMFPTRQIIRPKTHDIFVPRIGFEHRLPPAYGALWVGQVQVALRAGYSFQPTPFEAQRGYINLVDTDKHVMSAGAGITFNKALSFDAYGQYHHLIPIRFEKDLVDPDLPFEAVEAQGYILGGGASVSYHW